MVTQLFLSAWDARPYPYLPAHKICPDATNWETSKLVNGKLNHSSLAALVLELCVRAGLKPQQIDISLLKGVVSGVTFTQPQTTRALLELLQQAYGFVVHEQEGQLRFTMRHNAQLQLLDLQELCGDGDLLSLRSEERELPARVDVLYIDASKSYQPGYEYAEHGHSNSRKTLTLELPLALSASQANMIARQHLRLNWLAQMRYQLALPPKYACLTAGNLLQLPNELVLRATDISYGADGSLQVEAVREQIGLAPWMLASTASPYAAEPQATKPSAISLYCFELCYVDDAAPSQGFIYMAAVAAEEGCRGGGTLLVTTRPDDNYQPLLPIQAEQVVGKVLGQLPLAAYGLWDFASELKVLLQHGSLESVEVHNLAHNTALVGAEVLQFLEAKLVAPSTYLLTGLVRGVQGSEHAITAHQPGERFILLNAALIQVEAKLAERGMQRYYKALASGQTLSEASTYTYTYQALALKPLAPVHIRFAHFPGLVRFTWVRRSRVFAGWHDYVDVPLGEEGEAYSIEIWQNARKLRSFHNLRNQFYLYTTNMQLDDKLEQGVPISLRVCQLSNLVGHGAMGEKIFTL